MKDELGYQESLAYPKLLLIERCQKYHKNGFVIGRERYIKEKTIKRLYLCRYESGELWDALEQATCDYSLCFIFPSFHAFGQ